MTEIARTYTWTEIMDRISDEVRRVRTMSEDQGQLFGMMVLNETLDELARLRALSNGVLMTNGDTLLGRAAMIAEIQRAFPVRKFEVRTEGVVFVPVLKRKP